MHVRLTQPVHDQPEDVSTPTQPQDDGQHQPQTCGRLSAPLTVQGVASVGQVQQHQHHYHTPGQHLSVQHGHRTMNRINRERESIRRTTILPVRELMTIRNEKQRLAGSFGIIGGVKTRTIYLKITHCSFSW